MESEENIRTTIATRCMEVIEEKVEAGGEGIEEKPKPKKPSPKAIDLVAVLQTKPRQVPGRGGRGK